MTREMTLWRFAQALRDLQRHRILWALAGRISPDSTMREYWDSLR